MSEYITNCINQNAPVIAGKINTPADVEPPQCICEHSGQCAAEELRARTKKPVDRPVRSLN